MPIPKLRTPRRRGRWLAGLALLAATAAVVVIIVADNSSSNNRSGAGTTATGATTVERRNLVATDTESGTLSYANSQTVYNRLSGTITWVPQVGQVIRAGHTLFSVDNHPVLLMNGSTPAYRTLTASDASGPDVYELNRNLVALGYNPDGIVVDDTWQAATTAGVEELQYHLGETQSGTLTLGQVVFLPGPQMVQTVDTTVGSAASYTPAASSSSTLFIDYPRDPATTGTSTGTTTGTTTTSTTTTTLPTPTETSTTPTRTTTTPGPSTAPKPPTNGATDNLSRRTLQELLRLVQEQQRELQAEQRAAHSPSSSSGKPSSSSRTSSPSKGSSSSATSTGGGGGGNPVAVLSTSSTRLVVTVDLSASSQSEASVGERVTVEMPDGSTQGGRVTAVSPVAQSSSSSDSSGGAGVGGGGGGSGSSTVPVTIALNRPARGGGLDQASVSVNFVKSRASHVLSVPVTALLATSGSTFAVQEASSPHRLIPVHTGLFAAGYVEISGSGIHPGLKVTDSQG